MFEIIIFILGGNFYFFVFLFGVVYMSFEKSEESFDFRLEGINEFVKYVFLFFGEWFIRLENSWFLGFMVSFG